MTRLDQQPLSEEARRIDVYREWLGIETNGGKMHYYQLLGIRPFESDARVIENAAEERNHQLLEHLQGAHRHVAERLLAQMETAKSCLLDPEKRAKYDEKLRQYLNTVDTHEAIDTQQDNVADAVRGAMGGQVETKNRIIKRSTKEGNSFLRAVRGNIYAIGTTTAVAVAAVGYMVSSRTQKPEEKQVTNVVSRLPDAPLSVSEAASSPSSLDVAVHEEDGPMVEQVQQPPMSTSQSVSVVAQAPSVSEKPQKIVTREVIRTVSYAENEIPVVSAKPSSVPAKPSLEEKPISLEEVEAVQKKIESGPLGREVESSAGRVVVFKQSEALKGTERIAVLRLLRSNLTERETDVLIAVDSALLSLPIPTEIRKELAEDCEAIAAYFAKPPLPKRTYRMSVTEFNAAKADHQKRLVLQAQQAIALGESAHALHQDGSVRELLTNAAKLLPSQDPQKGRAIDLSTCISLEVIAAKEDSSLAPLAKETLKARLPKEHIDAAQQWLAKAEELEQPSLKRGAEFCLKRAWLYREALEPLPRVELEALIRKTCPDLLNDKATEPVPEIKKSESTSLDLLASLKRQGAEIHRGKWATVEEKGSDGKSHIVLRMKEAERSKRATYVVFPIERLESKSNRVHAVLTIDADSPVKNNDIVMSFPLGKDMASVVFNAWSGWRSAAMDVVNHQTKQFQGLSDKNPTITTVRPMRPGVPHDVVIEVREDQGKYTLTFFLNEQGQNSRKVFSYTGSQEDFRLSGHFGEARSAPQGQSRQFVGLGTCYGETISLSKLTLEPIREKQEDSPKGPSR